MVCTFSGWVEAFPTWTERASEVAQCLLREMVPRFGLPTSIGSDNGPALSADLVESDSKMLSNAEVRSRKTNYMEHIAISGDFSPG